MNQTLTTAEIEAHSVPIPLPAPAMTKREKLMRFAQLVRPSILQRFIFHDHFLIFHDLEHSSNLRLAECAHPASAFEVAGNDPVLQKAGLKKDYNFSLVSALEAKRFFELTRAELHEFSCDCGGSISNTEMANRIERIAAAS